MTKSPLQILNDLIIYNKVCFFWLYRFFKNSNLIVLLFSANLDMMWLMNKAHRMLEFSTSDVSYLILEIQS